MPSKAEVIASLRESINALEQDQVNSPTLFDSAEGCSLGRQKDHTSLTQDFRTSEGSNLGDQPETIAAGQPQIEKTADVAFQKILRWVSVRERSSIYLRKRLVKEGFEVSEIELALQRACLCSIVDDHRYAEALIRMQLSAGKGVCIVEREIRELGIEPSTLDAWMDYESQGREVDVERAIAFLRRRPPRAKQLQAAAYRKLISQGYSSDVASDAARKWYAECC